PASSGVTFARRDVRNSLMSLLVTTTVGTHSHRQTGPGSTPIPGDSLPERAHAVLDDETQTLIHLNACTRGEPPCAPPSSTDPATSVSRTGPNRPSSNPPTPSCAPWPLASAGRTCGVTGASPTCPSRRRSATSMSGSSKPSVTRSPPSDPDSLSSAGSCTATTPAPY